MFCFISLYIHVFIELIPCQFETIKLFVARFMLKFYRFEVLYLTCEHFIFALNNLHTGSTGL